MKVKTDISYGYASLIETFFNANNLDVEIQDMRAYPFGKIILNYDGDSETAYAITMLSVKHCGFENMLCDFLIKCGVDAHLIPIGQAPVAKRDMRELDKEWEQHRRNIGFR